MSPNVLERYFISLTRSIFFEGSPMHALPTPSTGYIPSGDYHTAYDDDNDDSEVGGALPSGTGISGQDDYPVRRRNRSLTVEEEGDGFPARGSEIHSAGRKPSSSSTSSFVHNHVQRRSSLPPFQSTQFATANEDDEEEEDENACETAPMLPNKRTMITTEAKTEAGEEPKTPSLPSIPLFPGPAPDLPSSPSFPSLDDYHSHYQYQYHHDHNHRGHHHDTHDDHTFDPPSSDYPTFQAGLDVSHPLDIEYLHRQSYSHPTSTDTEEENLNADSSYDTDAYTDTDTDMTGEWSFGPYTPAGSRRGTVVVHYDDQEDGDEGDQDGCSSIPCLPPYPHPSNTAVASICTDIDTSASTCMGLVSGLGILNVELGPTDASIEWRTTDTDVSVHNSGGGGNVDDGRGFTKAPETVDVLSGLEDERHGDVDANSRLHDTVASHSSMIRLTERLALLSSSLEHDVPPPPFTAHSSISRQSPVLETDFSLTGNDEERDSTSEDERAEGIEHQGGGGHVYDFQPVHGSVSSSQPYHYYEVRAGGDEQADNEVEEREEGGRGRDEEEEGGEDRVKWETGQEDYEDLHPSSPSSFLYSYSFSGHILTPIPECDSWESELCDTSPSSVVLPSHSPPAAKELHDVLCMSDHGSKGRQEEDQDEEDGEGNSSKPIHTHEPRTSPTNTLFTRPSSYTYAAKTSGATDNRALGHHTHTPPRALSLASSSTLTSTSAISQSGAPKSRPGISGVAFPGKYDTTKTEHTRSLSYPSRPYTPSFSSSYGDGYYDAEQSEEDRERGEEGREEEVSLLSGSRGLAWAKVRGDRRWR